MEEIMVQFMEMERVGSPIHEDFRVWITSEVNEDFPISLLQMCIKFTNEPPSGKNGFS